MVGSGGVAGGLVGVAAADHGVGWLLAVLVVAWLVGRWLGMVGRGERKRLVVEKIETGGGRGRGAVAAAPGAPVREAEAEWDDES